jgi:hypothetical protein
VRASWPTGRAGLAVRREDTMVVTDEQVAALHACLGARTDAGDEAAQELIRRLGPPSDGGPLAGLVYAAFVIAARQKFSPTGMHTEVVRFVAQIRALLSERPDLLDPVAAEQQLRSALGENVPAHPHAGTRVHTQVILLHALVQSQALDDTGLADLLHQARDLASNKTGSG